MSDQSVQVLFKEVRAKTLRRLRGLTSEAALCKPPGLRNSILWNAGHCYVIVESLLSRALGRSPNLPNGWLDMFGWRSDPGLVAPEEWPALGMVVAALRKQQQLFDELLAQVDVSRLTMPVDEESSRTARYLIVHALHDEACHSGEIWLMRKMWNAESDSQRK